jgi:hypothetical protein
VAVKTEVSSQKKRKQKEAHKFRVSDPDSIRSVDPDPYSETGSGREKINQQGRQNLDISCFEVLDVLFRE